MYASAHIVHLFMAILFVGTVFFEVLILETIRHRVSRDALREVESAVGQRARQIMPFVILLLFGSGLVMAYYHGPTLTNSWSSGFALQLGLKILLAFSVLAHFLTAMTWMVRRTMTSSRSRFIHYSVFSHVIVIVFLAKSMYYFG
ncbi:CopD family copper resistance protein [Hydrocarboniclastica marina]|uniref:Copper resistance protein D domain-containing protein n=1 Tax=Hydrocarboniclastica marina TaxID=2259620 RepID=A0A4P7XGI1_9ALTE|nr:hypothetical protein [Hydrocarboniclastica marina]MAL99369.1 hypothetical protein [Alteromonadaceae bacterium]QCF26109.1 hypothetical protein soil367_09295 [Hydrocarboniclastica marina]|tara:strand:+ start:977 stop:1411 length:435 start_codon:yes stop_codon:yes gene_type:complete